MIRLIVICIVIIFINIPFGYWRANVKKFSIQWVLAVHIPVPIIIAIRILTEIGFIWYTYIFLVTAFFIGQKIGSIIYHYLKKYDKVSSCLVMDLTRLCCHNN